MLLPLPIPRLRIYSRETVVAEKLEALVQLGMANSQMKDFFDLRFLACSFDFDGAVLSRAIAATFERRNTPIPAHAPIEGGLRHGGRDARPAYRNRAARSTGATRGSRPLGRGVDAGRTTSSAFPAHLRRWRSSNACGAESLSQISSHLPYRTRVASVGIAAPQGKGPSRSSKLSSPQARSLSHHARAGVPVFQQTAPRNATVLSRTRRRSRHRQQRRRRKPIGERAERRRHHLARSRYGSFGPSPSSRRS